MAGKIHGAHDAIEPVAEEEPPAVLAEHRAHRSVSGGNRPEQLAGARLQDLHAPVPAHAGHVDTGSVGRQGQSGRPGRQGKPVRDVMAGGIDDDDVPRAGAGYIDRLTGSRRGQPHRRHSRRCRALGQRGRSNRDNEAGGPYYRGRYQRDSQYFRSTA